MSKNYSLKEQEERLAWKFIIPPFLIVILLVLFPILTNIWLSFQRISLGGLGELSLSDTEMTIFNYIGIFSLRGFWRDLLITIFYSASGTIIAIFLGLGSALLANKHFKGRNIFRGILLLPWISPIVAVTYAWRFILDPQMGFLNYSLMDIGLLETPMAFLSQRPYALITVILFQGWRYFPFAFLFTLARLQAIPKQLHEQAKVDGAGIFKKFYYITLPLLKPVIVTIFLIRFIWNFNKFNDIYLLTSGHAGTRVLPIRVYDFAFGDLNIGAAAAVSMFLFFVLLVMVGSYFKFVVDEEEGGL